MEKIKKPRGGAVKGRAQRGSNTLNERQAIFVAEFLKDGNGRRAAIAAGYSPKTADVRATALMRESPPVMEALAKARKAIEVKGVYNLEKCMVEADAAISFAIQTENANAYVKAVELKAKMHGLLVEKHEVSVVPLTFNFGRYEAPKTIEAEVVNQIVDKRAEEDDGETEL